MAHLYKTSVLTTTGSSLSSNTQLLENNTSNNFVILNINVANENATQKAITICTETCNLTYQTPLNPDTTLAFPGGGAKIVLPPSANLYVVTDATNNVHSYVSYIDIG